jgi:phage baseplate assembly protein W
MARERETAASIEFVLASVDRVQGGGLQWSTRTGSLRLTRGAAAVRQALLILLTTTPGERVMRPDYGCELQRLVFLPNDATTAGLAMHYVTQAVERWEPRVELLNVEAQPDPNAPETLEITLRYRVRNTLETDALTVAYDLQGGAS